MHLTGTVVSLDSLLFVDLPRIDAAAHTYEKRDLKAVAPTQSDPDGLKKNLQSGMWVLKSHAPKVPMVSFYKQQWVFSPQALAIAPKGLIERAEKRFSLSTIATIDQADNAVVEGQRAIQTDKEKMIHELHQMFAFVRVKRPDEIRKDLGASFSKPFGPPGDYIVDRVLTDIANENTTNSNTFPGVAMWHSACTDHHFLKSSFPWYDFDACFNIQYEFSQWINNYHYKHTSAAYWALRNAPEPEPAKPSEYALNGTVKVDRWVQVRLVDEDGKALPNKDYKIYPKHNRKSALFSGTTDENGLSQRITLGHAFERVQVVFPEDQDSNIAESDNTDWTERVIDVLVKRPLVLLVPSPDNEPKVNNTKTEGCSVWVICEGEENIIKELLAIDDSMKNKLKEGAYNMGKGHSMTYHEAVWLWRNGNGTPVVVDGNVLNAGWIPLLGTTVLPLPLNESKVFGHVVTKPDSGSPLIPFDNRIYFDIYDFDVQTPAGWYDIGTHFRNALNRAAIDEHGEGTPYEIQIRYEDEFFN